MEALHHQISKPPLPTTVIVSVSQSNTLTNRDQRARKSIMSGRVQVQNPLNTVQDEPINDRLCAELMSRVLRNPEDPRLCIPAFFRALLVIMRSPAWTSNQIRGNYQDLLDAVLYFLSYPLDDETLSAMLRRWSRPCSCCRGDRVIRSLHNPGFVQEVHTLMFADVVNTLNVVICQATVNVSPVKLDAGATRNKWPRSFAALLPHGPVNLVNTTVRFTKLTMAKFPHQTMGTCMISTILYHCPSIIGPLLDSAELRESVALQLHNVVQALQSLTQEPSGPQGLRESLVTISWFMSRLEHASDRTRLRGYWGPVALQMYLDIIPLIPLIRSVLVFSDTHTRDHLVNCYLDHGKNMHRAIPIATPHIPPLQNEMAEKYSNEVSDTRLMIQRHMNSFLQDFSCAGPDCHRDPEFTNTAPLKKCSGCGVFRYCSKECQKAHWTWQMASHKEACAKLATFHVVLKQFKEQERESGYASEQRTMIAQELEAAGSTLEDADMLLRSLVAVKIARDRMQSSKVLRIMR